MVRLSDLTEIERRSLLDRDITRFDSEPWTAGPRLDRARIAIVTTAGLSRQGDRSFTLDSADYRVIPGGTDLRELVMTHVSTNFDRIGFQQDVNVVLPLDRLKELAAEGTVGSVAGFHYSFMGATNPDKLEPAARQLAGMLKEDEVNAVLLSPV